MIRQRRAQFGSRDAVRPFDDEPRFAGGAEIPLAYAHLSVVFDKARRAYSLTCDDDDGEAVHLILEPWELERIAQEFLAARGK